MAGRQKKSRQAGRQAGRKLQCYPGGRFAGDPVAFARWQAGRTAGAAEVSPRNDPDPSQAPSVPPKRQSPRNPERRQAETAGRQVYLQAGGRTVETQAWQVWQAER